MKALQHITLSLFLLTIGSCVSNYIPNINDYEEQLVVEGLITDQPGINTIKISNSEQLWKRQFPKPYTGCIVSISDDLGNTYNLKETAPKGTYITDPSTFRGVVGRTYTLHVKTTTESKNFNYQSKPVKMIPVPPVDSIYYEKKVFRPTNIPVEGCNIYLNTHDPSNNCKFYRWEYLETWEINLLFDFPNKVCWVSNQSKEIKIKNASLLPEASISRLPVITIQDPVDKLSVKYSILIKQFSLNEDEYFYWERFKNMIDQTGGLYDVLPSTIPNNIFCVEDPYKEVLGYFCVSAVSTKRLFIKDNFTGANTFYYKCFSDTIFTTRPDTLKDINSGIAWIVENNSIKKPPSVLVTYDRDCVDCRTRGTNIKPDYWDNDK
jgi:hypothetical protein